MLNEGRQRAAGGKRAPQKRYFRQRAHINPLSSNFSFAHPPAPELFNWDAVFGEDPEEVRRDAPVDILDIGCGFGGLLFGLRDITRHERILGLEIRMKVAEFVRLRILAERKQGVAGAERLSVQRINAMKYLPCFFRRGQLSKIFICFPDPQFKRAKHRRRIVSPALLTEYAFLLRPGGRLYTITDVEPLHKWMATHGEEHPSFRRLTDEELAADPAVEVMKYATEESKKVDREGRSKFVAVFDRVTDEEADARAAEGDFFDGYYGGVAVPRDDLC